MAAPLKLKRSGGVVHDVEIVALTDAMITARVDGEEIAAPLVRLADGSVIIGIDDRRYHLNGAKRAASIIVAAGAMSAEYQIVEQRRGGHHGGLTASSVDAPMPGTVLKILVSEGARVQTNDPLIVLEAMKTETTLSAESDAMIKRIHVQVGQRVDHGATLIELGPVAEA
jgi:3-methylcrotonyl-CoA carboxylase alpha subunit